MSRVKRNIIITDINESTDSITEQILSWNANFTQLHSDKTRVNLNFTQLESDFILNCETSQAVHCYISGLKNYTILITHQYTKDKLDTYQWFQPLYILNDKEHYETVIQPDTQLKFIFLHKHKKRLQVFEKFNYSDIEPYIDEHITNIHNAVNNLTEKAMTDPKLSWLPEQTELREFLLNELRTLRKTEGIRNIRKNEMKRRVSRLSVLEIMYGNPHRYVNLEKLSQTGRVSPRSLQTNFLAAYNISPTHFHKLIRLTAVNNILASRDPRDFQVTKAAISHGFTHLGQFSRDYKKYFTESPSETLFSD